MYFGKDLLIFILRVHVSTYMYIHALCMCSVSTEAKKNTKSPGTEITGECKPLVNGVGVLNLDSLEE